MVVLLLFNTRPTCDHFDLWHRLVMEALQQAVRANVGVASAPVALRRQVDNWSCVYCCLQMVLDYLAAHASGYAARLEGLGLVDAEGCAVSAEALHAAIARESTVAPAARKKIALHQATAALGPLRTSLIQILVKGSSKAETARGVVANVVDYYLDKSWPFGEAPPCLLVWGGHCRLVVGCFKVEQNWSIVLADPKTAACEAVDADQLKKKCASGNYELLMVKNDMAAPTR